MSAFGGDTDIRFQGRHVGFGPKPDIASRVIPPMSNYPILNIEVTGRIKYELLWYARNLSHVRTLSLRRGARGWPRRRSTQ